jgi:hypothetical protein
VRCPDYAGGGLVNLVAELERRLTGASPTVGLRPDLAEAIPAAATYVLVLFDALGDHQLRRHPSGEELRAHRVGALDASFSTQTSVATATLASGLPPSQHGLISYVLRMQPGGVPVNTLWWFTVDGSAPAIDLEGFLPAPNLAERLGLAGREAVVVEPAAYLGSPLDRVLYRGARTHGAAEGEVVDAVVAEASRPGRLVVCYLPQVDAAGHAEGTTSTAYAGAVEEATEIWRGIGSRLPDRAVMVGTADHGMVDVDPGRRLSVSPPDSLTLSGDDRVIYAYGDGHQAASFAADLPATWVPIEDVPDLWGPPPFHPELRHRLPTGLIVADDGVALHYPGNDLPLAGYHGGLTEEELRIPLLVWSGTR